MIRVFCAAILVLVSVTACTTSTNDRDPLAPPGLARGGQAADDLLVGHQLMAGGEYELALRSYRRAVIQKGLTPPVMNGMAVANMKLGRRVEAERLLRASVEQDRDFGPGWNNLGVLLAQKGEFIEAKRAFEIAFGLGGGRSLETKNNIAKTVAKIEETAYTEPTEQNDFELVRQQGGVYLLLKTPN